MRLKLKCNMCDEETIADMNDDGIFEFKCPKGHDNCIKLQNPKHFILYEIGFQALQDSNYREAISSFAASLERFFEYGIYIMSLRNPTNSAEIKKLSKTWKIIDNQSERQYGAFLFLYFSIFKNEPLCMKNKDINLRNKVVHKGYIANKDEAINYADSVAELIKYYTNLFENELPQGITNAIAITDKYLSVNSKGSLMCISTVLNNIIHTDGLTVRNIIDGFKVEKKYIG